ncbi:MAG: AMP-binding protein [Ilumatobacteraceae bacterium]
MPEGTEGDILLLAGRADPSAVAVDDGRTRVSWSELESRARRAARALLAAGATRDRPWALLSHNRVEWVELWLANTMAGSRYVPLNWHLTAPELAYLLTNSGSVLLVVEAALEPVGREAAALAGLSDASVMVIDAGYAQWRDAHPDTAPDNDTAGAPLQYTGGTTGASKGVVRPDQGLPLSRWGAGMAAWGGFVQMPETGRMLVTTPLYHAFGAGVLGAALNRGHSLVLRDRFDTGDFLETVERERITSAPLVPTLIVRLAKLEDSAFTSRDLSSLQWICHTAAPCPAWAKQRLIDLLGPVVVEFYGSSEGTGPVVCTSEEWMARPGTVGRPNPTLEVSVVDDDGHDLPTGEVGTLYFRRADGAPSYHGDEEKTRAARLADGRFTVGDLGYLDTEGFVYLVDRRVDLILNGGVNVYPAEIEAVISRHPAVRDVAVFGIPDPEFGQQVKAAVELEPGAELTADGLISWCRERLAGFKCPRSVDFHDALPREAHGKLKKRILRDAYWPSA